MTAIITHIKVLLKVPAHKIRRIFHGICSGIACLLASTMLIMPTQVSAIDISGGLNLGVTAMTKTLGTESITFWVYCVMGGTEPGSCTDPRLPGPLLELGVGATGTVNLTVPMMGGGMGGGMMAVEGPPYSGHTIHFHGLDVEQSEDGVPETGALVTGDEYTFSVDSRYVGSHKYHCHVHTVKHLEMGMYGPFVVRAVDSSGAFVNTINEGGPSYDFEWNLLLSTVDPRYHTATGDSPVFASYVPQYFLINGNEGLSADAPAETLTASVNAKLAIRLIGLQSINATFKILDATGNAQEFVLHNMDGFALHTPRTLTELSITPGQTRDIMITLPDTAGTFHPQVTYRSLHDDSPVATVFTALEFN